MKTKKHLFLPSKLKIICGPMFAGKTTELIANIIDFRRRQYLICCFKPKLDRRVNDVFFSRNGVSVLAKTIADSNQISEIIKKIEFDHQKIVKIVCFDETHFFDLGVVSVIKKLIKQQKMVICAGLHQGFSERRLPVMEQLRALADVEQFLFAKCAICNCPASKTQRINQDHQAIDPRLISDEELVGGSESYEARCDSHFVRFS